MNVCDINKIVYRGKSFMSLCTFRFTYLSKKNLYRNTFFFGETVSFLDQNFLSAKLFLSLESNFFGGAKLIFLGVKLFFGGEKKLLFWEQTFFVGGVKYFFWGEKLFFGGANFLFGVLNIFCGTPFRLEREREKVYANIYLAECG